MGVGCECMDGQEGGCMSLEVYYRRCLVVCGVVFGVCVASVVEGGGVWNRVGVPLTLWRPPVTRREGAFVAPWYTTTGTPPHQMMRCPVAYHNGSWTRDVVAGAGCQDTDESIYVGCSLVAERTWVWHHHDVTALDPPPMVLDASQASFSWIAFIGDSIARKVLVSLLHTIGEENPVFDRHADYEYKDDRVRVTLHWAPFPQNATSRLNAWADKTDDVVAPDVIVLSISLWHMLHIHNASLFESSIAGLRGALLNHHRTVGQMTRYFLMSSPEVYHDHLKSLEKKKYMTYSATDAYNRILVESGMLMMDAPAAAAAGTGLCTMLDVFRVTYGCGVECSQDGIHSRDSVYNVLVQILLNIVQYCGKK